MVGNERRLCPVDTRNYNTRYNEQQVFVPSEKNGRTGEDQWRTSTKDAFHKPEIQKDHVNGRRKQLVKKILREQILQCTLAEKDAKIVAEDGDHPSEYIESFCDPTFTPFMDQPDNVTNNLTKYSLYTCNNQTWYRQKIVKGELKSRSDISNWNEPFRRNCAFTTSPRDAFREPSGGY